MSTIRASISRRLSSFGWRRGSEAQRLVTNDDEAPEEHTFIELLSHAKSEANEGNKQLEENVKKLP